MNPRFKELCRELGVVPEVALAVLEQETTELQRRDRRGSRYGAADRAGALEAAT